MAVFLVSVLVVLVIFSPTIKGVSPDEESGILGGPAVVVAADDGSLPDALLGSQSAILLSVVGEIADFGGEPDYDSLAGSVGDPGQPLGPGSRDNLLLYQVQGGDTLSGIAAYFGVSLDTIANANPGVKARFIKPGDELNILPTSGVVYTTRGGDTLESIAAYFNVSERKIAQFNEAVNFGTLGAGVSLVVPGAKSFRLAQLNRTSLPSFAGQFVRPAEGFNWGRLHNHNAVDVANSCGTTVRASAEGLVVPDDSFGGGKDGWNGGYGSFVLIEHPFGDNIRTRYAHLSRVSVDIGDYVKQGEVIGTMGETGDASGCHVHFEVYGAVNPLAR